MPGRRAPLALLAASLVLLSGCGRTLLVGSDRTLSVGLTEYRIAPQSIHAPPGLLTILVHNYGRLTHNLVISRAGQPEAATAPISPGETAELAVTLGPGTYLVASTILSDQALGAYGTLTVS
jgi:hypothetical protein